MTRQNIVLVVSVGLNVCAASVGVCWLRHSQQPPEIPWRPPSPLGRFAPSSPETAVVGFRWSQLESSDFRVYISRLRAIGCPEETIQDVITAEINKLYAPKVAEAQAATGNQNYWQKLRPWSAEALSPQQELFREKNALISELLGINPELQARKQGMAQDQRYNFMSEEKRQPLATLEEKYADLDRRMRARCGGLMTPDDRTALATLQQQKAAEMSALLTPQEQFEYAVRTSPLARQLQQELDAFQPSETEFRAIYRAKAALEEKLHALQGGHDDSNLRNQLEPQLRSALGEDRYAEYQRSNDPGYQGLVQIADRFGLPRRVAAQVFVFKETADAQRRELLSNNQIEPYQRQASLQALREAAVAKIAGLLGEQGFRVYSNLSDQWIDRLTQ